MKIKLNELQPNPFKKYINDGKLNGDRLEILKESIDHGTLPENFFARKNNGGTWEMTSGHHRHRVLLDVKGSNYEVDITPVDFTDEQMLIDMVRENLTQRDTDFHDTFESIILARYWLQSKAPTVKQFHNRLKNGTLQGSEPQPDSYRSIAKFLSKKGKTLSYHTVKNYLDIRDKVSPEIIETIKKLKGGRTPENITSFKQAIAISGIKDFHEQKDVLEAIKNSREGRAYEYIPSYKNAPDKIKQLVRERKIDLADVKDYIQTEIPEEELEIPNEDVMNLQKELERERQEMRARLQTPEGKTQARLIRSWLAHSKLNVDDMTCPKCGKDHSKLRWICCDMNIDEVAKYLAEKLSKKRGEKNGKNM